MSYDDAMQGYPVSRANAMAEVKRHNLNPDHFLDEMGKEAFYNSKDVLEWLGY